MAKPTFASLSLLLIGSLFIGVVIGLLSGAIKINLEDIHDLQIESNWLIVLGVLAVSATICGLLSNLFDEEPLFEWR